MSGKIRNPARRCKICGGKCKRRMRYCKLCAKERGDTIAQMRISEPYDALKWYKDSKAKGEE